MRLLKSLLLGLPTAVAGVSAQAADLSVAKAAPVEYVRVCSTYGAGFFYIPGTETCLYIGGRVRAEYAYLEPTDREDDSIGFRARGRIEADARTETPYGLLRTFVRFEITRSSGTPYDQRGTIDTYAEPAEAYVQLGGLTAGRAVTFFYNLNLPTNHLGTLRFDDAPDVDVLAYTFEFGNGFSAALSLENSFDRSSSGVDPAAFTYAGHRVPDLVGNVKHTGTWGSAQLSGALHQIRSNNLVVPSRGTFPVYPDTEYGFAVSAQVGVNLPMLAANDAAWVAATYADGALSYITGYSAESFKTGALNLILADAVVNPVTGDLSKGRGWSIAGGLHHNWTPQFRQAVVGSYARFDYSAGAATAGLVDFNEWRLGTNLTWQPVSNLDLAAEIMYVQLDALGPIILPTGESISSDSAWEGRLQLQRDF
jgi:hypothetical protein